MKVIANDTTEKLMHSTGSNRGPTESIAVNPVISGGKSSPVLFVVNQCLDREEVTEFICHLQRWLDTGRF